MGGGLVALLLSELACVGPAGSPSGTEDSLRAALATYDSAWLAKDSPTVERILAPRYTYFTSIGGLNGKAATLAFLADTGCALTLSRRTDVRVKLQLRTAVVSSRWEVGAGIAPRRCATTRPGPDWLWRKDRWSSCPSTASIVHRPRRRLHE